MKQIIKMAADPACGYQVDRIMVEKGADGVATSGGECHEDSYDSKGSGGDGCFLVLIIVLVCLALYAIANWLFGPF